MSYNKLAFLAYCAEQPIITLTVTDPDTEEEVELTVDFMEHILENDDAYDAACDAYKAYIKAQGGGAEPTTSISFLVTMDEHGETIRQDAYSFGKGKNSDLDKMKLRHQIAQSKTDGNVTHSFRIDRNALSFMLDLDVSL